MNRKLTLSIENDVILLAKNYASNNGRSLSNIVEEFLKSLSTKNLKSDKITYDPLINELSGCIKINSDKADKELLIDALIKKHLK